MLNTSFEILIFDERKIKLQDPFSIDYVIGKIDFSILLKFI